MAEQRLVPRVAHLRHHANRFMAKRQGHLWVVGKALHDVKIRATNATRFDGHEHFPGADARFGEVHNLQDLGRYVAQYRCPHLARPPPSP